MKESYSRIEIELIVFETEDVITDSGPNGDNTEDLPVTNP